MRRAALLHDVGKLSLPNTILDKPTRLTDVELNLADGKRDVGRIKDHSCSRCICGAV